MKSNIEIDLYERVGVVAQWRRMSVPVPMWCKMFIAGILVEIAGTLAMFGYMLATTIARKHGWM